MLPDTDGCMMAVMNAPRVSGWTVASWSVRVIMSMKSHCQGMKLYILTQFGQMNQITIHLHRYYISFIQLFITLDTRLKSKLFITLIRQDSCSGMHNVLRFWRYLLLIWGHRWLRFVVLCVHFLPPTSDLTLFSTVCLNCNCKT